MAPFSVSDSDILDCYVSVSRTILGAAFVSEDDHDGFVDPLSLGFSDISFVMSGLCGSAF